MIIHLSATSMPVSWTIEAIYKSSYGIAYAAAQNWYTQGKGDLDQPQYIVQIVDDTRGGLVMTRDDLWMDASHLRRQTPDDGGWLVQDHTAPVKLDQAMVDAIVAALRARLSRFGYLIPRADWERRYPSQAMVSKRFADFSRAQDEFNAARNKDKAGGRRGRRNNAEKQMPFDLRWSAFMDAPKGFKFPYGVADGSITKLDDAGQPRAFIADELSGLDLEAAARMLNWGWTPAETAILLGNEPIDEALAPEGAKAV